MSELVEWLRATAILSAPPGSDGRKRLEEAADLLERQAREIESLKRTLREEYAKREALDLTVAEFEQALREIESVDPVDAALDPQRATRIAKTALLGRPCPALTVLAVPTPEIFEMNVDGAKVPMRVWRGRTHNGIDLDVYVFSIVPNEDEKESLSRVLPAYMKPTSASYDLGTLPGGEYEFRRKQS